ncbi:MAG: acyltransferase family protein [Arcanobacterium sp.]|nr:acyltransferase family protein [Arcanobacterium sp.]
MTTEIHTPKSHGGRLDALDGIRTIAVFLVIAFHVSFPYMNAGYIGVDMFFVLSGFLITGAILRELRQTGTINVANFWSRRIKRLMPAAVLTILTVFFWAQFFAPLYRRADLGADAWWSLFYVANWRFISSASYFESDGTVSPLLHMWSLAVEEQFYIFWPLIILLVTLFANNFRIQRRLEFAERAYFRVLIILTIIVTILITVSGLLFTVFYFQLGQDRAYMGTDTKAFEPLFGAFLAIISQIPLVQNFFVKNAKVLIWAGGIAMIAIFVVSDGPAKFYYLGGGVLFTIAMGAFLVGIANNLHGFEAQILAWQPISYLGRISYGLYLWHWPIAVWILDPNNGFEPLKALIVVALTIAVSIVSYHLIEMPIRSGRIGKLLKPKITFITGALVLAFSGLLVSLLGGTIISPYTQFLANKGTAPNKNVIMVVGDSVPARITPYLSEEAQKQGIEVVSAARGGCTPLGVAMHFGPEDDGSGALCSEVKELQENTVTQFNPGIVFWWSRYEIMNLLLPDGSIVTPDNPKFWEMQEASLQSAIERLTNNGATLVMVLTERPGLGTLSRVDGSLESQVIQRLMNDDESRIKFNNLLRKYAAENSQVKLIDGDSLFCTPDPGPGPGNLCDDMRNGSYIRYDGNHVNLPVHGEYISAELLRRIQAVTEK